MTNAGSGSQLTVAIATATASVTALMLLYYRRRHQHQNKQLADYDASFSNEAQEVSYQLIEAVIPEETEDGLRVFQSIDEKSDLDGNTSDSSASSPSRDPMSGAASLMAESITSIFAPLSGCEPTERKFEASSLSSDLPCYTNTQQSVSAAILLRTKTEVHVRRVNRRSYYDSDAVMMITQEDLLMMYELMELESEEEKETFDSYHYDRKCSASWS
jgi:hypothetical protein